VRSGESGVLPVVAGLIVIIAIFQYESSTFLTAGNIVNLLVQGAPFVLLGMAEVFVLLLAEIDLSIGFVAGIAAVIMATLATDPYNLGWVPAVAAGLAAAAAIGLLQGGLITRLRLPSFVVTLAGLLGWAGVLIALVSAQSPTNGGTIRITNNVILDFVNGSMSPTLGWIVMAASVGAFAALLLIGEARRRANGLVTAPFALTLLKIAATAAAGIVLVLICNADRGFVVPIRGVPWVVPIVIGLLVAWTILLGRTRFGRYFYAIGGNPEAARRAGIDVRRIRLASFVLCGFTAGVGGVIYASRLGSISTGVDGGTLVLFAIAAAVIGGTSLFGGRGKMVHALLGGLVVATIFNGMGLIGLAADSQDIVTALVLLAAVAVDALVSRSRTA
jgi:D-xylose transport system permease protein